MADQKYTVELDFVLSADAKQRIKAGVSSMEEEVRRAQAGTPGQFKGTTHKEYEEELKRIEKELDHLSDVQNEVWTKGKKASKEYAKSVGDSTKSVDELATAATKAAAAEENLQAKAVANIRNRASQLRAESTILRRSASDLDLFARSAIIGGTALLGGIFTFANKYVSEAKQATQVTVQWKREQDNIKKSTSEIGSVLAREALPTLRQAAKFMSDAAKFIDTHPQVVPAAIKAGEILIGIGVIGKAVATGIRLTADSLTIQSAVLRLQAARMDQDSAVKYLEAAGLMNEASDKQLAGAGGGGVKGGGFFGALADATVLLGSFSAGLILADKFFDHVTGHDVKFNDYMTEIKQLLTVDAKYLGDALSKASKTTLFGKDVGQFISPTAGNDWFKKVGEALGLLKTKADAAANAVNNIDLGKVENSPAKEQILNAYEDLLNDEKDLQQKYNDDVFKTNQDALNDELKANQDYADKIKKINDSLAKSLSSAAADFAKQNADADKKYEEQKASIIQDGADAIEKIHQQLQDRLNKLAQENSDRQAELLAQRDAVGLVKQQRKYQQDKAEAIKEAADEVRDRKKETQKRLADLKQSYEEEKAARLQAYQDRVNEIKQQAADQLKELADEHRQEIEKIHQQRAEKLRELDLQFIAERNRRYQYFITQIKDLDASLLGETKLRQMRQDQMLKILDDWLVTMRNHWSTGLNALTTNVPAKDSGGYVSRGLYRMAWDNQKEFVLSGSTTSAAEKLLGTNLTQESIMGALRGVGGTTQANYIDQRRMESPMSKEQVEIFRRVAVEALTQVIGR